MKFLQTTPRDHIPHEAEGPPCPRGTENSSNLTAVRSCHRIDVQIYNKPNNAPNARALPFTQPVIATGPIVQQDA
jgi:hypothetical protein